MRIVLLAVAVMSVITFATESMVDCNVVGKGIVKCSSLRFSKKDGEPIINTFVYHFKRDGSFVEKKLQGGGGEYWYKSTRQVVTSVHTDLESWPCLVKVIDGFYSMSEGNCIDMSSSFIRKIMNGEKFGVITHDGKNPFDMAGSKDVSWMICESPTRVTTLGSHKITGLSTDMKVFDNLKPGTYCDDFMATDALYWKP